VKKPGIMICGHGSRSETAEQEFGLLAKGLRARYPDIPVEYGFLEYSAPNIHMGLDALIERGVEEIYAVPGMLFAATHAKNDIPSVLTTYRAEHAGLTVYYGRELGLHEQMIAAFETRILESMGIDERPKIGSLYDTLLVVVGRGTSDVNANAEAAKMTRIVNENLGFGWAETVYSGVTYPSVGRGLEMALRLGFKKVVVAPYFLFSGHLITRIYNYVDAVAGQYPEVEFFKADYLRDQVQVIDTFVARIEECMRGQTKDEQDLMASFEARLARGEVEVHHHHAEFQPHGEHQPRHRLSHDDQHHHSHQHDHGSNHRHSHGVYRHIAHPHGPRTMLDENLCCCFMSQFPAELIDEERALRAARGSKALRDELPACAPESN
jgi:sirohydrochlorin cobaltochelatase